MRRIDIVLYQNFIPERVSKMSPQCDPETGPVKEGAVDGEQMLMTNQQAAKLSQPGMGSFYIPSAPVAARLRPSS
jgi:hypothetical protein